MCEPTTMAMGMMGASTIAGASGAAKEAEAAQNAAEFNSQVAEMQARDAANRGQRTVDSIRQKGNQTKGQQIAALAANGVLIDSGSALQILSQTEKMVNLDSELAYENAKKEAQGFKTQSILEQNKADSISPSSAGFTSLLGGATSMASSYAGFKASGAVS